MLRPLCITAALAVGLASGAALAQTTARASTAGTTGATTSTTGTTSSTGTSAAMGGCSGSNGSSCSASNSNGGATAGSATTTGSTLDTNTVQAPATSGSATTGSNPTARPALENATSVDPALTRPEPFAPGGSFGPAAVPAANETGTGVTTGTGIAIPEGTQTGTQQNVFVQPQARPSVTVLNTPLFDQAAREGRAKESRRRAAGNEPRVYGIAPRTDRDLTWQMPDDPIIRY